MKNILYITQDEISIKNDSIYNNIDIEFIILKSLDELFTYLGPKINQVVGIFIDLDAIKSNLEDNKLTIHDIVHTITTVNNCFNLDIKTAIGISPNVSAATIKEVLTVNKIKGIYPQGIQVDISEKNLALKEILSGKCHIPLSIKKRLKKNRTCTPKTDNKIKLTPRESQVLSLLINRGSSNKSIAKILKISESAVKLHMTSILKKFGCQNRLQLALNCKDSYTLK